MYSQVDIADRHVIRPTHVVIDLDVLGQNYLSIKHAVPSKKIMPILKANAYGHGLIEVGQHLSQFEPDYFGVAYLEEGILLRNAGINIPVLVLGGILGDQIPAFLEYDLTITASSVDKLHQIEECAREHGKNARVHLKIDTGMERIGMHHFSADRLIEASTRCSHCHIEGIFTHLARSEDRDSSFSLLQIERFKDVLSIYDRRGISRPLAHCGNSGAILYGQDDLFDMVRPGLLLYGLLPDHSREEKINVKPCLTWKTKVVYFKVVQAGVPVSYSGTWTSPKMTRIVTLPVGYGDGYFRALSNRAKVIIRGKTYPVIGNICMDQMMVDIGWDEAFNGDEVILLGVDGENTINANNLAEWAGTISYEILTNINARVPRLYLEPKKKAKKNRIPKQVSGKHTFKGVYKGMNE